MSQNPWNSTSPHRLAVSSPRVISLTSRRSQSTLSEANHEDYLDENVGNHSLDYRSKGHAAAAETRTKNSSHEDSWTINLGRDTLGNEWLVGDRSEEWFTGVHPRDCPGESMLS